MMSLQNRLNYVLLLDINSANEKLHMEGVQGGKRVVRFVLFFYWWNELNECNSTA